MTDFKLCFSLNRLKLVKYFLIFIIICTLIYLFYVSIIRKNRNNLSGTPVQQIEILTTTRQYDFARYQAAFYIADWWKELGLNVKVTPLDFNDLTVSIRDTPTDDKQWSAFLYGWTGRVERADPDMFIYSITHSSQAGGVGNNYFEYKDSDYDALAEAQRRVSDPELRKIIVHAAQEKLAEDIPFISLYYRYVINAYRNDKWNNLIAMSGEGLFHEWLPYQVFPITKDKKSTLVIAGNQEPKTLNPLVASTVWEWKLLRWMYDKLARVNQYFRPEPWAAEEINQITDIIIDVKLRENMTFHDGTLVKPEDVKFSFDFMIENNVGYFKAFLSPLQRVEIIDNNTIRFTLKQAYAPFISNTLAQIPILPKHLWKDFKQTESSDVPLIGSGPFKIDKTDKSNILRFNVFDNHFSAKNLNIDNFEYKIFPDIDSMLSAILEGKVDLIVVNLGFEDIDILKDNKFVTVSSVPDIGFHFLGFNCYNSPFQDKNLRKAVSYAIDLNYLLENLLQGYGDIGGQGQPISSGNSFWKNHTIKSIEFNIDKAREFLKKSGYSWDENNRLLYP